jgi:ribokinase
MFDVLTIGTATRDTFLRSDAFKIIKDPKHLEKLGFVSGEAECLPLGGKVEVERPIETIGGGAANAAVTFARWGFTTGAVIQIGNDSNGKAILATLQKEKVKVLASIETKEGTGCSTLLLAKNGERTILHYRGASKDLALHGRSLTSLRSRAVYIAPGNIQFSVMRKIVTHFKKQGALIAMNPSKYYLEHRSEMRPMLQLIDVVLMNREEGAYLTGAKFEDEKTIFRRFDALVPGLALMTDGPHGVMVSDGTRFYSAGVFKEKKLVDRTGSGDAFGSGFVAGLLSHRQGQRFSKEAIEYALRVGSANATSVVEYVGAEVGILRKAALSSSRFKKFAITEHAL